jgi:hypothetical protein
MNIGAFMKNKFVNLICCLYHEVYFFLYSILFYLNLLSCPKKTGTILVSDKGEAKIQMCHTPKFVRVFFNDKCLEIPCNPQQIDYLTYDLDLCCLVLNISWDVSSVREVVWELY